MGAAEEHAALAPSHADTWFNCPGSKQLEATVPPDPEGEETEYSRRGTAAHEGLELCLKHQASPVKLGGRTMSNGVTLNAEDVSAVQSALDYVQGLQSQATSKRLPFQLFTEEKLEIGRYLGNRNDIYGTADIQFFSGNDLEVIDYKHGYRHKEAEGNLQLILYAIGAMAKAYDAQTKRLALRKVKMTIIQPRGEDSSNPIRSWIVEPDDLFSWAEKLTAAASATDQPGAPLVPGDKQCRWCRAREVCPAREQYQRNSLEKVMQIPGNQNTPDWDAPMEVFDVSTPEPLDPVSDASFRWENIGNIMAQPIEHLSLETRIAIHRQADMLKSFLADNAEGLRKLAMGGTAVPGYKLIEALGNTAYRVPEEEIIKKVGNLKGKDEEGKQKKLVATDEYMPRKLIGPAQLLKLVKSRVSKRVYANLQELTHRPIKGPALVPESQAGKPWKPPADQMFEKQEEEQPPKMPSFL